MTTESGAILDDEDVDVPISALEHYSYCPRQCALIHIEQVWDENQFTIRGKQAHERVDTAGDRFEKDVLVVRAMPVWSEQLGIRGRADVVEYRAEGPYPVEYKVGRRRGRHADVQLCAQALCLEEMLGVAVLRGAVFYHAERRRYEITFDPMLRERTAAMIEAVRTMLQTQTVPPAPNDARCPSCSLIDACMPAVVGEPDRMRGLQGASFRPMNLTP